MADLEWRDEGMNVKKSCSEMELVKVICSYIQYIVDENNRYIKWSGNQR